MRVFADQDRCVGSGQCVLTAPAVFDQRDEDGIVTLLTDDPPPGEHEAVRRAAVLCPAMAIRLAGS
ncbi:ferredoxin [Microtetraspora sp. NBRC 13810]|uniref:ferredoxin n=1 Tax=Microtetraspora sp. NBRC 13810 TaxID=3030990 RepID=UPI0024A21656|nr:ferredoxin [Microtetraspora sp. NBRC 13810]GLW05699.1 ferredoxin [Microtetraspora sp. NBRC 13810]